MYNIFLGYHCCYSGFADERKTLPIVQLHVPYSWENKNGPGHAYIIDVSSSYSHAVHKYSLQKKPHRFMAAKKVN